ncbi:hypothetical protein ACOMHN_056384 [Nucella lapillus]
MASRLPDKLEFSDWRWLGRHLAQVIAVMDIGSPHILTEAIVGADAEEMMKTKQLEAASNSYHVAIVASKLGNFLELNEVLKLICRYSESLMKQKKFTPAFNAALATTEIRPDFAEGYMLMSLGLKEEGGHPLAVTCLLRGIERCQLSSDDNVRFITESSKHFSDALLELQRAGSIYSPKFTPQDVVAMCGCNPQLPKSPAIWTRVLSTLAEQKQWFSIAILTVGVGLREDLRLTVCLYQACSAEVDCSAIHVEDMYMNLSVLEIKKWGDLLACFILDHKGNVGKRTKDPLAIHLTKLSVANASSEVFRWALQNADPESLDLDSTDSKGSTPLHILARSTPFCDFHSELMERLVLNGGALVNLADCNGMIPQDYLPAISTRLAKMMLVALKTPPEGFIKRIENLKQEGNQAHRAKNSARALSLYHKAATTIKNSPYKMLRDLAILYNNMAAVHSSNNDNEQACTMADMSAQIDPSYHKPYWRLGRSLAEKQQHWKACDKFLQGVDSGQADADQKVQFVQEICSLLPSLTDKEAESVLRRLKPHLASCWTRVIEFLSKSSAWDAIRRLVLGPPEEGMAAQALVQAGWKFADCYKAGKQKVGYAMSLKAKTAALHTLVEKVENSHPKDDTGWVTDLVLALLLQGADPTTLLPEDEVTTWYHILLFLSCITEKLGLMHYILSDDMRLKEARVAVNNENRTLLHAVCLHFGDGQHAVGRQLVELLLEKGLNPASTDVMVKKAHDYVAPQSAMHKMLLRGPGPGPKSSEEMKERGNAEYKKKNYRDAIEYYTQAISMLRKKLPVDILMIKGHDSKKHEVAVLFSNRSECHLQLGHVEQALTDAKDSVAFDGHWYRGHIRVARALLRKNKASGAVKAFSNAFSALETDATESQRKDILKEIVKTVISQSADHIPDRIPNLGYVSADLWMKISYDYFCSGNIQCQQHGPHNDDWKAAIFCLTQCRKSTTSVDKSLNIRLNLKPLCSWMMEQNVAVEVMDMIIFLVARGSDPTTLSFYEGDTYIHASAIFAVLSGSTNLLDFLMQTRTIPNGEENLQDLDGNTALHVFADPHSRRFAPPPSPLHPLRPLSHSPQLGGQPQAPPPRLVKTPAAPPKPSSTTTTTTKTDTAQTKSSQPSKGPITGGGATGTGRPAESSGNNNSSNNNQRLQCSQCESVLAEAKEYFAQDKTRMGYSKLVNVLSYKHQKDSRHEKFVKESLQLMVKELGKSLTPDVPDVVLKMSQPHLHKVLEKLASQDKWRQMQVVVDKARSNDVPRGTFAKNMSLLALLRDKGLCGAEAQRLQILNLLLQHGAVLHPSRRKEAMEVTIQHSEWRLVERLVEFGVEPRFITLEPHDTPLHAALSIALDRDKGNTFSLFEELMALYEKDPHKYRYLDLHCVDKLGNTLLHLACKAHYSKHSHKAVELLVSKDIPVDVKNSDGKTAIEYLKSHDRRTQYLKMVGKQSVTTTTAAAASSKRKDSDATAAATKPHSPSPPVSSESEQHPTSKRTPEGGGDNEGESLERRLEVDRPGFRTKDAQTWLTSLVDLLSELTPAEAQLARSSKGKWLEMGRRPPPSKDMVSDSEEEDEEEEGETKGGKAVGGAGVLPKESGDAQPCEASAQNSDEEEEEGEEKVEDSAEDLLTFDNLAWEVECTVEVWKTLRDQRLTDDMKQRIVRSIRLLASGEWRPQLCWKVRGSPEGLNLHQAKFVKGGRILWELAIAFSPRLSEAAEKRIDEDQRKGEFAVRGGRVYTEIIRVWDIVFHSKQQLRPAVQRIIQSHQRGEHCLVRKELKGVKSQQFKGGGTRRRYPMLYSETDISEDARLALQSEEPVGKLQLCPPASASEMEFHILKFYCFSSALVYNVLKNLEMKIDFPFRVTDREHAVINLQSQAPILLLGRSGTGKTTCCLYRLWSRFLSYWSKSKDMEYAAWLPRTVHFVSPEDEPEEEEEEEEDPNAELFKGLLDKEGQGKSKRASAAAAAAAAASASASASDNHPPRLSSPTEEGCWEEDDGYEEGEEKEEGGEGEEEEEEAGVTSHVKYDHLHQLFVTKNQVLCSEVQKNFRELCHADDIAQHHVIVEESALPHRLQDVDEYKFPLFLTSRQLILILDASLPPPHFFERNEDGSLRVIIHGWGADEEIFAFVPLEDDSDEEDDEDYLEEEEGEDRKEGDNQAGADHQPRKKDNRREVTYSVFAHEIWSKITKKIQVNYHPSLVWTEIMSFIKGSFASLTQPKGFLDQDGYEKLGRKQAPNFTGSRHKVYELFLRYTDYKRQNGLYDEADLVFNIYQRLKTVGPLPWVLHEVFVDETQDFTQAELTVLIRLAHSPNDMFLTGDTAQSIMRGVSFRFSDLKTLFHYAKQSLKARGKTGMLEVPRQVYQLTHNYRSHAGILSLASAVLDLLVEYFPESFDRLEKDQGLFDGPQPVVLESGSPADLALLLSGNKRKTSHIEFGAHQVILVVNEEARNKLPEELGLGLVLTIYEAKGLEFDDVLLYNFFKDSEAEKEWRVVTEFLERLSKKEAVASSSSGGLVEIDEDVLQQVGRPRPLNFDPNLHKILNSELKHLYTAVTRARVNVWIFDQASEKRAPMFEYFKARKLVKFVSMKQGVDDSGIFAEKSSPEEWEKRGDEIMHRSLYDVAAKCYSMAGARHKQSIAVAHQRALRASQMRAQPRQMRDEFLKAAVLFLECHRELLKSSSTLALRYNLVMKAGRCLQNARENHLAALVFEKNGQLEVAAPLYVRARKWLAASQCFERVDHFGRALKILDEQELYDQAIDCLQRYNIRTQDIEKKGMPLPKALVDHKPDGSYTIASFSYKAAKFYFRYGETQKMLAAIERLPNKEEQIKFLQKHGFLQDAALLMRKDGRIAEATRMMLQNGQADKAIRIAEEGTDCSLRAQCYLFKAQRLLDSASSRRDRQDAAAAAAKATTDKALTGDGGDAGSVDSSPSKQKGAQGGKKPPPPKSGKKKDEAPSSDEEDEGSSPDDSQQQVVVVDLLERACQQFDVSKNYSGMGECQLLLAELRSNKEMLEMSFRNFATAQPVANTTGMLECVEALRKISANDSLDSKSCGRLILGVEKVFDAVCTLLRPTTAEDKNRYQLFLSYYGLERSGDTDLVFHPKLKPRFLRMLGKRQVFANKAQIGRLSVSFQEEKKEERLHRSAQEVVNLLAHFLIQRTNDWCQDLQSFLEFRLPEVLHCAVFQEGRTCEDEQYCPYMHKMYTQVTTILSFLRFRAVFHLFPMTTSTDLPSL